LNPNFINNATSKSSFDWFKENGLLFDKLLGAYSYQVRSTIQAISAPGWSSIFCS
jgi:hypothetical protein